MLQISNLTKVYGDQILFEDVTFGLVQGEKVGLVGRNGSGKSTLFRLILGIETPDEGTITAPRGYRIGHLEQHLKFTESSVLKEACLGLRPDERDQEYRAEIILDGLGFSQEDVHKHPSTFSGGFQIRINLAKLLLSEPDMLLLDEPTNYLDILSVRWLTGFLQEWRGEIIIISHDKLFMDDITTHTMLIHRSTVKKMPGGTAKLYAQVAQDEEIYEKTRINEDKKRKQLEEFINRFRAQASKATLVQSKIKALERMGQKDELQDEAVLDFKFCESPIPGKQVAEIRHLSFEYPEGPKLIDDLTFQIGKNDRIAVIGKNGKGKSTLLKLLAAELTPQAGTVSINQNAKLGYFGQTNISRLNPSLTVEEEITQSNPRLHRTKVRNIAGTMMFSGDAALKKISVLSGGERSRVLLGKILAEPTNLLLLDEPTNHLDMESIEALIESLQGYDGAVVIVTHSELILKRLATKLIIFQGEKPRVFLHDYDYFLEKEGWGDEIHMTHLNAAPPSKKVTAQSEKNTIAPPKKSKGNAQREIKKIEERIYQLEEESKSVEQLISEASQKSDSKQLNQLTLRLKEIHDEVEAGFSELEQLSKRQ